MFLKVVYTLTFSAWIGTMVAILSIKIAFEDKVPLCMFSTMGIFGIATLAIKWHERRNQQAAK